MENAIGLKAKHLVYDINRKLIKSKEDIGFTRTPTVMTPAQKKEAQRCDNCGRVRVFPKGSLECLHCIRGLGSESESI